jgi:aquaporin Z
MHAVNKYLAEFIGTFFLVLVIGLTAIGGGGAGPLAPLAIGVGLTVLVYAGGHISGAHYNPGVTLAVWMRGRCDTKDVAPYIVAQLAGAVIAALLTGYFKDLSGVAAAEPDVVKALLAEVLFTFALVYVILNVATSKATDGNSYYGLAIGLTVTAGAYAVGGISGAAFNPAVAVGVSVMGASAWANIWIFLVANFGGAALAALVFKTMNPEDP